jgi:uncharacterized protein (TIGR02646 family)
MHTVVRNAPPESLVHKHREWTTLLRANADIQDNWDCLDKNTKGDIKAALKEMYQGCCCYCEGKVELTSYLHIEHFKPKSRYKNLCYDYNNLHYCCERCNITKGTKYSTRMFSPTTHKPEQFIEYVGETACGKDTGGRGAYMIEVLKLNERRELKDERAKIVRDFEARKLDINISLERIIRNHYNKNDIELILPHIKTLILSIESRMQHGESYCSMIRHNFHGYLQTLKRITEVLEDKCAQS